MNTKFKNFFIVGTLLVLSISGLIYSLAGRFDESTIRQALANPIEPSCQDTGTSAVWNPYPISTRFPNPSLSTNNCQDIPMLSFFPVNTTAGNPREITIIEDEQISIMVYYNNGANPGGSAIQSPTVGIEVIKESETRWRIRGTLSGSNVTSVTSTQKGGDLIVNVPEGTEFNLVSRSTTHFPDSIEEKFRVDNEGGFPNVDIPDNTQGSNVSNPIYTRFDTQTLTSTNGFVVKNQGLEAGFLGYGYILSDINIDVETQSTNTPPQIPGEEITIVRGESGSFQPLSPTDPENHIPISLDTSQIPSFCNLTGTPDATGGGQVINCQTDQNTPDRTTFVITPTDSLGLIGTPGTFIVNVIEPGLAAEKICVVPGTTTQCSQANLSIGDDIEYQITARNTSDVILRNLSIVDTYDSTAIGSISAISDNGVHTASNAQINWSSLGDLSAGASKTVTFRAVVLATAPVSSDIVNTAVVSADNVDDITVRAVFQLGANDLIAQKTCVKKNTSTSCDAAALSVGETVTYTITVRNPGPRPATGVVIADTYENDKLENITNISNNGVHNSTAGTITWNVGNLAVNASTSVTFDADIKTTVPPSTTIENIAVISSNEYRDIRVDVDFRTVIVADLTPRSGGGTALLITTAGIATLALGLYTYKRYSSKYAVGFVPSRSTEDVPATGLKSGKSIRAKKKK